MKSLHTGRLELAGGKSGWEINIWALIYLQEMCYMHINKKKIIGLSCQNMIVQGREREKERAL